ncbi:ankyrin repeat domain-containing protein SOWAHC [Nothobranchius furzeri]|uniref:Ankyrin repeat domain-containing protein SOWAHC-like n=1 Tax=Nothobranchius furzeri TaxID=105023 RepID=A0A1A8B3Q7_NOTFU|nr:ankyrin repeat domain-containing protein SOWAHC-like [Nothobranchius furzeri]
MGNSFTQHRGSREEEQRGKDQIPEISVIQASPLPVQGSMFIMPGPEQPGPEHTGLRSTERHAGIEGQRPKVSEHAQVSPASMEEECEDGGDESLFVSDTRSLSGSEDTPRCSRRHFLEVMMSTSPEVRHNVDLRGSLYLSRSSSDSQVFSNMEDDRTSVALDPLEHEWMLRSPDGEWNSLHRLLIAEPSLAVRKDFVTGFTCLHWAAKLGRPELIALIMNFSRQHDVPVSVDVRSNSGYTPLHIAAMHRHLEVLKLLVGAYNADVEVRDYSGRKAFQYLTGGVSVDIQDIIGAYEQSKSESPDRRVGGRWRFSKVLHTNLNTPRLLGTTDSLDGEDQHGEKLVRRRSSLSRMKPKLEKLRRRTSQIVHSTSHHDQEKLEGSKKGFFKSRPNTHFFG